MIKSLFYSSILLVFISCSIDQNNSYKEWETIISEKQEWSYRLGVSNAPAKWSSINFKDESWKTGIGGIGYGDNDDQTIIDTVQSVYLRTRFTIFDKSQIIHAVINADYDDAFVAYINGKEIARANVGEAGKPTEFDSKPNYHREAHMYNGGHPEYFEISKQEIEKLFNNGENVLAIHLINDRKKSSDLTGLFYLAIKHTSQKDTSYNNPKWFIPPVNLKSSTLPIVKINTHENSIVDDPRINAEMQIQYNNKGIPNFISDSSSHYNGNISIEYRGSSSQKRFPKKSYGLETQTKNGANHNISLLGMPEDNDWILNGPYCDKSLLRNVFAFDFYRKMGNIAPRTHFCELIINDKYQGVYVLMEKIKRGKHRVPISKLKEKDITGGYIIKIDKKTGSGGQGWKSSIQPAHYGDRSLFFQYEYPKAKKITDAQEEYIQSFICDFEFAMVSEDYTDSFYGYRNYINTASFIDFFILNELLFNVDGYRLSTFLYKNSDRKDGRLHIGPPWDFNLSIGNGYDCNKQNSEGFMVDYNDTCPNKKKSQIPFWWKQLLKDKQFKQELYNRWQELRADLLLEKNINGFIDIQSKRLVTAQKRNFQKWRTIEDKMWPNIKHTKTYEEEIGYMKSWLNKRINWLDQHMPR